MEDRHMIAFALCAVLAVVFAVVGIRHLNNRRQFKIRQSGRGKNSDSVPAE